VINRSKRFLNLFIKRKAWVRRVVVASLASATAWIAGDQLVPNGGLVAAIVCALSIRISLYKSVREGFGQIIGTAIGASVALLTVHYFNFGFIAVGATVFLCSVVARGLRLGEVASVNVPVTALIVIGPGISGSTATHRLSSTLIGAGIAIVFSYFSHAKTPAGRTIDQIYRIGNKSAELLIEMSEGVASGYSQEDAGHWLARSRALVRKLPELRLQTSDAQGYTRWIRIGQRDEADRASLESLAIEHTLVQIRVIARSIFDSAVSVGVPDIARKEIAVALSAASYALSAHIEDPEDIVGATKSPTEDLREATATLTQTLMSENAKVSRAQIVKGLSVVSNLEIIADSLDYKSPALNDQVEGE
jgi:uncharacterized membrane protein YgaE (UPF0421/DUF939 family)